MQRCRELCQLRLQNPPENTELLRLHLWQEHLWSFLPERLNFLPLICKEIKPPRSAATDLPPPGLNDAG